MLGNQISLTNNVAKQVVSVTATQNQTDFTVQGGYRINQLGVYRNGVRLVDGRDFLARNGSSVTLVSQGANAGDAMEFVVFDDFRVADALSVNSGGTVNASVNITGALQMGTGTSIFSPADNTLTLGTNDVERLRINSNGNVTIGPPLTNLGKLHVRAADECNFVVREESTALVLSAETNSGRDNNRQMSLEGSAYVFITSGTEKVRINSAGNVGINESDPLAKLHIDGSGTAPCLILPDSTNSRFSTGFGNINVPGVGQRLDFYAGDSGSNTANLTSAARRMSLTATGQLGIGTDSPNGRLSVTTSANEHAFRIDQDHTTALLQFLETGSASYAGDGIKMHYIRGATSAMNFMACDSNHGGTPDREFTLRGDGNAYADGTWNNNGADYAEFFESSTGAAIPVGTTVVLENNKVRAATSEDSASSIMGVVRPKEPGQASMTIGNSAWNKWSGKYLTDDFDRFILDEHVVYEWTETGEDGQEINHSYESHQIPEGVTIPSDVVGLTTDPKGNRFVHYRLNPDFDPSVTYVPREERDEWIIVGLIGQVKILGGQPMNDRWVKMRDVSDSVEEWFIR